MSALNKTYKKPYYELEQAALTTGFGRLPDLGYNVGVYKFTPWEVLYPMQKFDRAGVSAALKKTSGRTFRKDPTGKESE